MTDHAHELRRYARKIAHPAGDVPAVMLAAADEIERLQSMIYARMMTSAERDALRAKIEAMEQQEPVAWCATDETGTVIEALGMNQSRRFDTALYLAQGAHPTPSIPEGWKLVPTAESRHPGIYKMLGALHIVDNTPGASEWESYAAFLAAAPEAKP